MPTTCAVCIAIDRNLTNSLLPTVVNYRGYSLCFEHLQLWEANREAEWEEVIDLAARAEPDNQLPEIVVVKVDLSDAKTDEEKMEKIEEAVEEFDKLPPVDAAFEDPDACLLPDFVGDTEAVTQHEESKKPNSDNSTEELLELAKPKGLARKRRRRGKKK